MHIGHHVQVQTSQLEQVHPDCDDHDWACHFFNDHSGDDALLQHDEAVEGIIHEAYPHIDEAVSAVIDHFGENGELTYEQYQEAIQSYSESAEEHHEECA